MQQQVKTGLGVALIIILAITVAVITWKIIKFKQGIQMRQVVQTQAPSQVTTEKQAESKVESLNYCDRTFTAERLEINGVDIIDRIMQLYIAEDKNNCINFEQIENIAAFKDLEGDTTRIILYEDKALTEEDRQLSPDKQLEKLFSNINYPQVNEFRISEGLLYEVAKFDGSSRLLGKIDTIDVSDWKTYRNEKYGFELKYPASLGFTESETSKDLLKSQIIADSPGYDVFMFGLAYKKDLEFNENGGINVDVIKRENNNAIPAEADDKHVVEKGGYVFILNVWGTDQYYYGLFKQVVSTFKFIN